MQPQTAKNFNTIPLNKPLSKDFLKSLDLNELEELKINLVKRAAAVIGQISSMTAANQFMKDQFAKGLFVCEIELPSGEQVFRYSCEPRMRSTQFFVPGSWFNAYLDEREQLLLKQAEITANLPEIKKQKLINQFLGSQPKSTKKVEAVGSL